MNWQYRTVLFEFRKDGLLGDRYIDDEEMEKVLNELGGKGWELVSVTPVQEGLLAFFKRALSQPVKQAAVKPAAAAPAVSISSSGKPVPAKPVQGQENTAAKPERPAEKPARRPDAVGGIKIS